MSHNVLTQFNSPNYTPGSQVPAFYGMSRSIDFIVIHWWGDPGSNPTFEGVVSWLCNSRSQVSAHDVVTGTGRRVAFIVDNNNAAWHAGSSLGNAKGLGFECDPRCRDEDYQVVAEDIAETWKFYGRIIPLLPHKHFKATACPGNYDLNRLYNMAMEYYRGVVTPKATAEEIKQAYRDILEREADAGGLATYLASGKTIGEVRNILLSSQEKKDLEARKAADYAKNEWVRNLTPYVPSDTEFKQSVKLAVVPAEGIKRYNLENGTVLNNDVIPKATNIDVVAKTVVNGVEYYISSYSKTKGQAVGLRASELAVPAQPPVNDKPEWLENLKDITDQYFYARSIAPVLNIENGQFVRQLSINDRVLVTHSTQIVGKDLLVLEGGKEVVDTVYLSDEPIKDPRDDLDVEVENRLTALEKIVKIITDFLDKVFKDWRK